MKDWNTDEDANASTDRWIAWEAALVGFLILLVIGDSLYNCAAALVYAHPSHASRRSGLWL